MLEKADFAKCHYDGTYTFDKENKLTTKVLGGKLDAPFDLLPDQESKEIYTIEFKNGVPEDYCFRFVYKSAIKDYVKNYIQQLTANLGHKLSDKFFSYTFTLNIAVRPPPKKTSPAKQ